MKVSILVFLQFLQSYAAGSGNIKETWTCTKMGFDCIFPFTYQEETYRQCVESKQGSWCGLQANIKDKKHGVTFDYCVPTCTRDSKSRCTKRGEKCLFPILQNGRNYSRCFPPEPGSKRIAGWCYVSADKTKWGLCDDHCPEKENVIKINKTGQSKIIKMNHDNSFPKNTTLLSSATTSKPASETMQILLAAEEDPTNLPRHTNSTGEMISEADNSSVVLGVALAVAVMVLIITGVIVYHRKVRIRQTSRPTTASSTGYESSPNFGLSTMNYAGSFA